MPILRARRRASAALTALALLVTLSSAGARGERLLHAYHAAQGTGRRCGRPLGYRRGRARHRGPLGGAAGRWTGRAAAHEQGRRSDLPGTAAGRRPGRSTKAALMSALGMPGSPTTSRSRMIRGQLGLGPPRYAAPRHGSEPGGHRRVGRVAQRSSGRFACVGNRRRVVAWADGDWERPSTIRLRFLPVRPATASVRGGRPVVPRERLQLGRARGRAGQGLAHVGDDYPPHPGHGVRHRPRRRTTRSTAGAVPDPPESRTEAFRPSRWVQPARG